VADVHYPPGGGARAALVVAQELRFATVVGEHVAWVERVEPYQPGRFALRELPALRVVLADAGTLDLLVVDGYVSLDPAGRPGLGAHVHREFGFPVIGIAKNVFRAASHAIPVSRGRATRPLYVTAIGVEPARAASWVSDMAGSYRLPDAVRRADALGRSAY
jgi:deoxyribonuclease V